jgi:hypothetical protein
MSTGKYKLSNYHAANASRSKLSSAQEWMSRCRLVRHTHTHTRKRNKSVRFPPSQPQLMNSDVMQGTTALWDLRFPQRSRRGFRSSGLLRCVAGLLIIDVSGEYTSFILKGDAWHSSTVLNAAHAFQAVSEYNNTADQCPKPDMCRDVQLPASTVTPSGMYFTIQG